MYRVPWGLSSDNGRVVQRPSGPTKPKLFTLWCFIQKNFVNHCLKPIGVSPMAQPLGLEATGPQCTSLWGTPQPRGWTRSLDQRPSAKGRDQAAARRPTGTRPLTWAHRGHLIPQPGCPRDLHLLLPSRHPLCEHRQLGCAAGLQKTLVSTRQT